MKSIVFVDIEVNPNSQKILDIGCIKNDGSTFHAPSIPNFIGFVKDAEFVCGHNIIHHDLKYLQQALNQAVYKPEKVIDTLFISPLLFPSKPYHKLLKDDKLQTDEINNPLNDAIKAKDLFYDELAAFNALPIRFKQIYFALLHDKPTFSAFFAYTGFIWAEPKLEENIREIFYDHICEAANLSEFIHKYPIELAYCLALINCQSKYSITPPWVLKNYPKVAQIMLQLRNKPCLNLCAYCRQAFDINAGLKKYFGFDAYRTYGGVPLQENAVNAAINNQSILAVFPTGGGKSITFQVPAFMDAENMKGLTVVISPLQSLMKDQVDNLEKLGITEAVTINGSLDPIERGKSFERVAAGNASLLYISPESLRSNTIKRLLLGRKIARFVIDEAHCFSAWGQDFRVDYLYIGDFIKILQEEKNLDEPIPVSCFTATAKQKVIEDIRTYFKGKLGLDLEVFRSSIARTNLHYEVSEQRDEEAKYNAARDLVEDKNCPTIVYVSRTHKAYSLAQRLCDDGFNAKPYHGKMDVKEKTNNQNAFLAGEVQIMVATSAFGMGVDKKDVGLVIHYEISDSLENYIQEAGRAGRDEQITAECFVLFNEEDLSKHFILLNQTKLSLKEIQQVWRAIKELTRFRSKISNSALEIARTAGWDDTVNEIETRVTTAISALEEAGYLQRGQNMPKVFANSILSKTAQEAVDKIRNSPQFSDKQKELGVRIIKKLFSQKNTKHAQDEVAEARVDYISDHLGIVKEEVIKIVDLLRGENILADAKDLNAFINKAENKNKSIAIVELFCAIEFLLASIFEVQEATYDIKELNEKAAEKGISSANPNKIKTIINFWAIKNWIKRNSHPQSKNHFTLVCVQPKSLLKDKLHKKYELAKFVVKYLFDKSNLTLHKEAGDKDEVLVEFSVLELKEAFENTQGLFEFKVSSDDIEDTLFYLSRIDALKIEGGFLVVYNRLTIDRIEKDNKIAYKKDDYQKLNQFYENKIQQIHIVGEYAKKMIADYTGALQFVEDYFQLNYTSFLNKYFPGSRQNEIKRNITPAKFHQLFGTLSPSQLEIIKDNINKYMVVAAGPGSGKTRVLVHKLASLLLMEDVKHEQLLMLTFSRAATSEFKKRLLGLIGNAANFIAIKTFHSFCFELLGKVGSLQKSGAIIKEAVAKILAGEVEKSSITKTVLVIDEAQDMDADEFALITALMHKNEDIRVIMVGDDDQNIFEFRGADAKYLEQFIKEKRALKNELIVNYRSKSNLVDFANQWVANLDKRMKETAIVAHQSLEGEIKIVKHANKHVLMPLVQEIVTSDLSGSTCVLTKTNDEALQVTGLLIDRGVLAKLIQSNEGFNLANLVEFRFFLEELDKASSDFVINDEYWDQAKINLVQKFKNSKHVNLCLNVLSDFETCNPKRKYRSDLEIFIRESKLEDGYGSDNETIFVSTIHKAKGKEFDNVFLLLEDFDVSNDAQKRLLYVAITRAKQKLCIHTNGHFLDFIKVPNLTRLQNKEVHLPPKRLAMQLGFKDVYLSYFKQKQSVINKLMSGQTMFINDNRCVNRDGECLVVFSKSFMQIIANQKASGFELVAAKVNLIVYWQQEGDSEEFKIVLPEVCFEKK